MAVLFVSHSSKDDPVATALEAWLRANGFTDVFVDHQSLAGGAKWREELRISAGACRVVVCLITENWLASNECFNEFRAAWYMGKRLIPLLLLPPFPNLGDEAAKRFAEVCAEFQGIDLTPCLGPGRVLDLEADANVASRLKVGLRAAGALSRVGLDPEAFEIDRKLRPTPFPGLTSFGDEDADAALFYGRSREIAQALDALRQMRAAAERRPFVILGASGAGKSSLLKAGIIPRLSREAPAWLPLRAFRPGADPLLNFAEALARSLADFRTTEAHGVIRDRLFETWSEAERDGNEIAPAGRKAIEAALEAEGRKLRAAAGRDGATILISVDQAEEIARTEGDSGDALADYLRAASVAATSNWQLALSIRTDSFHELQSNRRFQALEVRGYDLRAIPVFRFESVVQEPAKRYGVEVDHRLVEALTEDAPKEDALPLLAFALQRLWRQYAASGALTRNNYDKVGGLKGLIEDAAERALRGLAPAEDMPPHSGPPPKRRVDLAASTFVPALAQVNELGSTIRRIAAWTSFSDDQQELLIIFEQWRLVIRKGEGGSGTIEVAHEALFREWTRLKGWLEPERARLEALRSLQVDASNWNRNDRDAAFLNHRDKRLVEALELISIEGYRKRLSAPEHDYLAACRATERLARSQKQRVQVLIYALFIGIIAGLVGWINQSYIREQWRWYAVVQPFLQATVRPHVLPPAAEQSLKPKDNFRECAAENGRDYCPEMVVVPVGSFVMGSPPDETARNGNEGPQHDVTIARPFAVSKFELTFDEWDTCVDYGDCEPQVRDAGWGRGRQPMIYVSWNDAQRYVEWLSRMTGKPYRLLTEAEYQYATRAAVKTAYPWGDDVRANGAAMADCNGCGSRWDERQAAPVGSFVANSFGLFDMVGNVWQWVEDCVHQNYEGAPVDGSAWADGNCNRHVVAGGAWNTGPQTVRAASHNSSSAGYRGDDVGIRVGRTLAP
jgi:formylglycine-generating enzyme required for sulfatase activity